MFLEGLKEVAEKIVNVPMLLITRKQETHKEMIITAFPWEYDNYLYTCISNI